MHALLFDLDNTLADRDEAFARWAGWFVRERLGVAEPLEIEAAASALMLLDAGGHAPKVALFLAAHDKAHLPWKIVANGSSPA